MTDEREIGFFNVEDTVSMLPDSLGLLLSENRRLKTENVALSELLDRAVTLLKHYPSESEIPGGRALVYCDHNHLREHPKEKE